MLITSPNNSTTLTPCGRYPPPLQQESHSSLYALFVTPAPDAESWIFTFQHLLRCLHQTPSPSSMSVRDPGRYRKSKVKRAVKSHNAKDCSPSCLLNLGHGRPTFSDTTASRAHSGATRAHSYEDHRRGESSEHKPVEGRACLELVASLGSVVGSVCQAVVEEVRLLFGLVISNCWLWKLPYVYI